MLQSTYRPQTIPQLLETQLSCSCFPAFGKIIPTDNPDILPAQAYATVAEGSFIDILLFIKKKTS